VVHTPVTSEAMTEVEKEMKRVRTTPAYGTCGAVMIEWDRISNTGSPVY